MQFFISFIMRLWCQTKPGAFFFFLLCFAFFFFFQFDKWMDTQRRRILTVLLERCSLSQQKFCCWKLQEKIPAEALDFMTKLPKVLSLYIFSFLDPQSLCHCAQAQIKKQGSVFCKDSLENTEPWGKKENMHTKPSTDKMLTAFCLHSLDWPHLFVSGCALSAHRREKVSHC